MSSKMSPIPYDEELLFYKSIKEWLPWDEVEGDTIYKREIAEIKRQFEEEWKKKNTDYYSVRNTPPGRYAYHEAPVFWRVPGEIDRVASKYLDRVYEAQLRFTARRSGELIKRPQVLEKQYINESLVEFDPATGFAKFRNSHTFRKNSNGYKLVNWWFNHVSSELKTRGMPRPVPIDHIVKEAGITSQKFEDLFMDTKRHLGIRKKDEIVWRFSNSLALRGNRFKLPD